MPKPHNPPVFPRTVSKTRNEECAPIQDSCAYIDSIGGMSLRDWMAGQILNGMMANGRGIVNAVDWMPKEAYALADAMLKEREKDL